ncbi:MAG: hypothetical protein K2F78_00015, partial [Muribaculaceae bacterium]|nr:hypothetical protein [Muribaculaceae bacterium]
AEAQSRFATMNVGAVLEALSVARDRLQSFNILERMAAAEAAQVKAKAEADGLEVLVQRSRKQFEELDFGHKEWAAIARASLYEGCTCPVCRQKVSARPPVEELLNTQWLNAKKTLGEDLDALAAAQKRLSALDAQLIELRRSHSGLSHRLDAIPIDGSDREAMKKTLADSLAEAERAEAEIAMAKELAEKTQAAYLAVLKDKESAEKARACAAQALSAAEATLTTLDEKARQTLLRADTGLAELLAKPYMKAWIKPGDFDPAVFVADFRAAYRDLDSLKQRRRRMSATIETADTRLAAAADAIDALADSLPEWNDVLPAKTVSDADVFAFLGSFVSKACSCAERRRHVLAEVARLDAAVEQFLKENSRFTLQSLTALFHTDEAVLEKTRERIAETDRNCTRCEAALESAKAQMAEHENVGPDLTEEDTVDALRERKHTAENNIAELNRSTGALVQQLQNDAESRSRQEAIFERLAVAAKESERWGRLNNLFGDKEGNRFRNIALSFVLENLLVAANRYLAMLTDRYRLKGVEGTYLILLEDAYNGYRSRPVVTSSGGESFMVSLSLALALADFGNSFVADTLFIDEGFGTLSGEPLQRAVGMLRSLNRSSGRRVGIISHIAELKAELPVQILVDADPSRGASTVSVTGAL